MTELLKELRKKVIIGFVGGSDLVKISEQLAVDHKPSTGRSSVSAIISVLNATNPAVESFDYAFAENGLTAYKAGKVLESQSFIKFLGEEKYKPLVNFILHYLADMDIPIKR